ncbi:MAG: endonuclease/exonuclease/phosphatase family protein [Planctomycetaceae bacterium]|nr:endonuclease/exonuclease/phosphatase family protein [Planctomycetaceae bacterium]
MTLRTIILSACFGLLLPTAVEANDVRVMSFNIRYGTARDGDNIWDNRREFVVDTIRAFGPDLLGTQETLKFQRDYLAAALPDYECLGVGRDDGKDRGEMMAVYFRRDRFEKVDQGHFWLSETPDVAGSRSWDSSLPRMATWLRLKDVRHPNAADIVFINTHFDHRGAVARKNSAALLRQRAAKLSDCRVIITGDFNAAVDSPPYRALFADEGKLPSPVMDSRAVLHAASPDDGTFSGFQQASTKGARIDWIAVTRDWVVKAAEIDRTSRKGRTPSDHFPVTAILETVD